MARIGFPAARILLGVAMCTWVSGSGAAYAGTLTVLHDFTGGADGGDPTSVAVDVAGDLFGTTYAGGSGNKGVVFKLSASGQFTVLLNFLGAANGEHPAGITIYNGKLYGVTEAGGKFGNGVLFSMLKNGLDFKKLHEFDGTDGTQPTQLPQIAADGTLYGTTAYGGPGYVSGGSQGVGVLYSLTPEGVYTLRNGGGTESAMVGNVVLDSAGNVFTSSADAVNEYAPSSGVTSRIYIEPSNNSAGALPLISAVDSQGNIYGTAQQGSASGAAPYGCIFELTKTKSGYSFGLLHAFTDGLDGWNPVDPLILQNNVITGTTQKGGLTKRSQNAQGVLYQYVLGGGLTVLHDFVATNAGTIAGGLMPTGTPAIRQGVIYGTAAGGGTDKEGVLYKFVQ